MYVRQVHESSSHGPLVYQTKAYSYMGVFYNLLIRKEIYNLMGEKALDYRASETLKDLGDFSNLLSDTESESEDNDENESPVDTEKLLKPVTSNADDKSEDDVEKKECPVDTEKKRLKPVPSDADDESEDDDEEEEFPVDPDQVQKLLVSYLKFKDPKNATIDITEDIFNVAMLNRMFFRHPVLPFDPKFLNMDNIKTVLKHVVTFDRRNILLNPVVGCDYFTGDANVILDDILLQINTSIHRFQVTRIQSRIHMYQLLLYALGVFVREDKEIRKFKVYNPLLGFEYFFEIPHLDFNEFRKLVEEIKPL